VADSPTKRTSGDQEWIKIDLDELYLMDYLFFSQNPSFREQISKYRQKPSISVKNPFRFVYEEDQWGPRVALDRTRQALSNGTIRVLKSRIIVPKVPQIPPKIEFFTSNSTTDSLNDVC